MERKDSVRHAAWYGAPIPDFLSASDATILGELASASTFDDAVDQKGAWAEEIAILKPALSGLVGWVYLEFDVPRLGARIDAAVVIGAAVVPIEFKVGESEFLRADFEQAWDYGLDLKNFHAASHNADLFPILVATDADAGELDWSPAHGDGVRPPCRANSATLSTILRRARALATGCDIDGGAWGTAPYRPTPTIIQAARALYAQHSVDAISRSDAGARNLSVTSARVESIIDEARARHSKEIVFVTGVPGAGKTLVGMNVATRRREEKDPTHAVFLSGNGPLVDVLREALTRDEVRRIRQRGGKARKGVVAQKVQAFIQNVHHFRDEGLRDEANAPDEHVVIFDEAQRAWNLARTARFMQQRKKRPGFTHSEPEFLLSYMDRHREWGVVLCLVGGGQEIGAGEAGIGAWLDAVKVKFPHWRVHISPRLADSEYEALESLASMGPRVAIREERDLHLAVSMRSFRAESLSAFVKAALDGEVAHARSMQSALGARYPVVVTRDLGRAKQWVRARARGSETYGLLASSKAERLKPHAVDVRVKVDPVQWFLSPREDTGSSFYLEDAATEFHVQGLELDWTCVTWDADLRRSEGGWSHHAFRGRRWERVVKEERRRYLLNAYRVLLTRARQGMAIFVPPGDDGDPTRVPSYYDETYRYLTSLGLPVLEP